MSEMKSCCESGGGACCESDCASSSYQVSDSKDPLIFATKDKNSNALDIKKFSTEIDVNLEITHLGGDHDHSHAHASATVTEKITTTKSCCDGGGCCGEDVIINSHTHEEYSQPSRAFNCHDHRDHEDSCCGDDHGHSSHSHGNRDDSCCGDDHGHSSHTHNARDDSCCGDDHGQSSHTHNARDDSRCGDDHGHSSHTHNARDDSCCGDDHGRSVHQHSSTHDHEHKHSITSDSCSVAITVSSDLIQLIDKKCSSCDPSSPIPHAIQVTRFRIANLCCGSEERLILSTLQGFHGVEKVDVNVVGRYAVVKHCNVDCCAPASKIADKLNEHRLGATVNEAFGEENTDDGDGVSQLEIVHSVVVFALFIVGVIVQQVAQVDGEYNSMIIFLVSTSLGLLPVIHAAYISLTRFTLDIHVLMIVATVGAIADEEYLDSSLLMSLFVMAELIEDYVMVRVSRAVRLNTGSMPKRAVLSNGKSIPLEEVQVGDILAIRAGEMILADGSVLKGESVVDESALTGEAKPLPKKKGDKVSSGTIVQNGYLEVTVEAKPSDSTMNKLRDAVLDVQADKGEYGRMVDRISVYWTPGILISALCLAVIGGGVTTLWRDYALKALVLLVLACPCALVVAAPIPSVCSIAAAARKNVLIRGSTVIEKAGLVTTIALDKTGTLTKGFFKVTNKLILPVCNDEGYDPVELAAAVEERSAHPLASAIVAECCGCVGEMAELKLSLPKVSKVKVLDGAGLEGWVEHGPSSSDWYHVSIGNERLLKSGGGKAMVDSTMMNEIKEFESKFRNSSIVYICVDDNLSAIFALSDEVRPESKYAVARMKSSGRRVVMLTGDSLEVAKQVCQTVGVSSVDCHARLLPQGKLEWVQLAEGRGERVCMVGDGINDASALAGATVGVAMGAGGSAMATEAADIVMMSDNIMRIPETLAICRMGRAIIIQNCSLAIAIKIIAVVIAVLGYLQFWQAVLIDIGTLLLVVANGTRPLGLEALERNMSMFRYDSTGAADSVSVAVESASQDDLVEDEGTQLHISMVNDIKDKGSKILSDTGHYQMTQRRARSSSGEASVLLPLRGNEKESP